MNRRKEQGFTLIELLIVVAIIAIVAAIAVPNLLNARKAANEASAISALRAISSAQVSYSATNNKFGTITQLITEGFLDDRFSGTKLINGYKITPVTTAATGLPGGTTGLQALEGSTFGYEADANDNAGRYNYIMYSDFIVRYKPAVSPATLPTGYVSYDPVGGGTPAKP
jgi:prepilin-type N-terminal cleavage/methylation domain-containing protein